MKKFNPKTCTLTELNRELKRLASRKCRSKTEGDRLEAENQYNTLVETKTKRFGTKKTYETMTSEEIKGLSLEDTVKGIKSLQSKRCTRPDLKDQVLRVESRFQAHREELMDKARFEELKKRFS